MPICRARLALLGAAVFALTANKPAPNSAARPDPLAPTGRWSANVQGNAELPPMGWNSWNAFGSAIDEAKVLASARIIKQSGLQAKGYRYIDLDDGWWLKRQQPSGRMEIRGKDFPSAVMPDGTTSFRPLTDKLHAMGFKAGIYSDIGRNTCAEMYSPNGPNLPEGTRAEREVGLYGHVDQDIELYFQDWGFDLIKVDACGIRGLTPDSAWVKSGRFRALPGLVDTNSLQRTNIPAVRALYQHVANALAKYNPDHDYVFSICLWGAADVREWARNVGNMSRTSDDLAPTWGRMLHSYDTAVRRPLYSHPGSFNDPDMLYIGAGDFDADHLVAARSHFALWAMLDAPLLIGLDMRKATPALLRILGNSRIIALDQDPAGNQAVLAFDSNDIQILVKTLASGDKAVAIFNRTSGPLKATLTARQMKYITTADIHLTNLWTGQQLTFHGAHDFKLQPRQTLVFKVHGTRRLANGIYLSEEPGSVNPAVDGVVVPQLSPMIYRPVFWGGTRGTGQHPRYGGWGGAQADQTPYGKEIEIGGKLFDTGIGVLADSRLEVRNAGYKRFHALVGVDDSARNRSQPVTFLVYGDGKLLARSKPMHFGEAAADLSANVSGRKIVELVARTPQHQRFPDPVDWAEAALTR